MTAPITTHVDTRDEFIRMVAKGLSFCDVGGLWGTVNERVSVAAAAGASSMTMLDVSPFANPLWDKFEARMQDLGIREYGRVSANVDDADLAERAGSFDVLHCSGLLYHCPNPLYSLAQLRRITRQYLVLTSIVVPERIENDAGVLETHSGQAVFVPYIDGQPRAVLREHLTSLGIKGVRGVDRDAAHWGVDDYASWWWVPAVETLRRWIESAGFKVVDDGPAWAGRSHAFLAGVAEPP
jgi:ubiquinone/menaquinone biosynthesis C-methylase UbiE